MEREQETVVDGYTKFIDRLASCSARPLLGDVLDFTSVEWVGMGNFGYVMTCHQKRTGKKVVLKIQSPRWVDVVVNEWVHGSSLGDHGNIVKFLDVLMHRDDDEAMKKLLDEGFDSGALQGRKPKMFPTTFMCLIIEYMDSGDVGTLIEKRLLCLEGVAAVTRQVASALAFMHQHKCTHNDIKPENILLKQVTGQGHLVAKLADLGLAHHSVDRRRDTELLGYTICCMGRREKFQKCPATNERTAVASKLRAELRPHGSRGMTVADIVEGLWKEEFDVAQVAELNGLEGCEVMIPPDWADSGRLEKTAKSEIKRRALLVLSRTKAMAAKLVSKLPSRTECSTFGSGSES